MFRSLPSSSALPLDRGAARGARRSRAWTRRSSPEEEGGQEDQQQSPLPRRAARRRPPARPRPRPRWPARRGRQRPLRRPRRQRRRRGSTCPRQLRPRRSRRCRCRPRLRRRGRRHHHLRGARRHRPDGGPAAARGGQRASFNRGEYDKAALAAWELMNDPKMAPLQLESQYLLGKTLYRMGQYHAALGEFSQILARGKDTKFFSKSLEWLFFISHKTVNESVILDEVARYANADWPERTGTSSTTSWPATTSSADGRWTRWSRRPRRRRASRKPGSSPSPSPRALASTPRPGTWRGSPGSVTGRCPWRWRR